MTECVFDVYSSTTPYTGYSSLASGLTGLTYEDGAGTVGNTETNTFYYLTAHACGNLETAVSNTAGAFDFGITPGN